MPKPPLTVKLDLELPRSTFSSPYSVQPYVERTLRNLLLLRSGTYQQRACRRQKRILTRRMVEVT
jgi:hypothetical protein